MKNNQRIKDAEKALALAQENIDAVSRIRHDEINSLSGHDIKTESKEYLLLIKKYDIRKNQRIIDMQNACYAGQKILVPLINANPSWYESSQLFNYAAKMCDAESTYLKEEDCKVRLAIETFMHRFSSYTEYVNGHDYQNNPILIIHPVVQIDTDTHKKELNALADTISPILTQCASKDIRLYKQIACVQHSSLVDDSSAKVELKTVAYMEKKDSFRIVRWKPHAYPSGKTETHVGSLREALHWVYDNYVPGTTRKE